MQTEDSSTADSHCEELAHPQLSLFKCITHKCKEETIFH
uniref:Uncharacterized protein n=1 Tax=Anguilla anguilla TaxID=7936 RepID=A0A0E9W106_ANGAN